MCIKYKNTCGLRHSYKIINFITYNVKKSRKRMITSQITIKLNVFTSIIYIYSFDFFFDFYSPIKDYFGESK